MKVGHQKSQRKCLNASHKHDQKKKKLVMKKFKMRTFYRNIEYGKI